MNHGGIGVNSHHPDGPYASCEWACGRVAAKDKKLGGERGIRTLGTPFGRTHDFQSCSFSQLGHLSVKRPWFICQKLQSQPGAQTIPGSRLPLATESMCPTLARPSNLIPQSGGEGGIRTHVPCSSQDKSISSRPRYGLFGTSPFPWPRSVRRSRKKRCNNRAHSSPRTPAITSRR
jgi:hypothetical protein